MGSKQAKEGDEGTHAPGDDVVDGDGKEENGEKDAPVAEEGEKDHEDAVKA